MPASPDLEAAYRLLADRVEKFQNYLKDTQYSARIGRANVEAMADVLKEVRRLGG